MRQTEALGQNKGFADTGHGNTEDHVVANLCRLARTDVAAMNDLLAHGVEQRLAAGKGIVCTANHEGQRAGGSAACAARDGRIQ
ncbi:hypothetical protein D3C86_2075790 [compost metagenome]